MRDIDCNALLVRDGERTGIVTGMNLSKAVVLKGMTIDEPVRASRNTTSSPFRRTISCRRFCC